VRAVASRVYGEQRERALFRVLAAAWALLLGMFLLQIGNGMQGSLMGVRGEIEGFSTFELSLISAAYFLGFLGGSRMTPGFIRRVGHVRVFAALGSFISAVLVLYPSAPHPWAWVLLRVVIGFCYSGVYVTAESWLNNSTGNATRGQALSLYMVAQVLGIIVGQTLLNVGDPGGFLLFVIPSVLVSISFAPILLSVAPAPAFATSAPMSLVALYRTSPTSVVGMALMGGIFAAQFGMSAVYASHAGLNLVELSVFISMIFVGALVMQYPIGWLSDRMDRRLLIMILALIGAIGGVIGMVFGEYYNAILVAAFISGGVANPLYSLLIAYTNDYLRPEDMPAASGGLIFANGLGAIAGPVLTGQALTLIGPVGFWAYDGGLMALVAVWTAYRMTQRPSPFVDEPDYGAVKYAVLHPGATPVAAELAQEVYLENATDEAAGPP